MTDELLSNHLAFESDQYARAQFAYTSLSQFSDSFLESYKNLTTLNGWGEYILSGTLSSNAYSFFVEAQNDALVAHLLARQGMWRPSLQSLRSCVENTLLSLYYADHAVELKLWEQGRHKAGFTELVAYFLAHPNFHDVAMKDLVGIELLKSEYALLSKAVHGSSAAFRMGDAENIPNVYVPDEVTLGKWMTNQRRVLKGLNLVLLTFHREKLLGTAYPGLRKALSNVFDGKWGTKIKAAHGIVIPR